jgi:hypothetical protein
MFIYVVVALFIVSLLIQEADISFMDKLQSQGGTNYRLSFHLVIFRHSTCVPRGYKLLYEYENKIHISTADEHVCHCLCHKFMFIAKFLFDTLATDS